MKIYYKFHLDLIMNNIIITNTQKYKKKKRKQFIMEKKQNWLEKNITIFKKKFDLVIENI